MKIQYKIIIIPLVVMLLVSTITIIMIERQLHDLLIERNINEMSILAETSLNSLTTVELIAHKSPEHLSKSFQSLAKNFADAGDFRVTYIDANGKVLGDSERTYAQLKQLDNHANRDEVKQALEHGKGIAKRFSSTLKTNMLYVAIRSNESVHTNTSSLIAHPIITRISRPQLIINAATDEVRKSLFTKGLLSLFAVLILGLFGAKTMTKTVNSEQQLLENRVKDRTIEISMLQTFIGLLNACSTMSEAGEVMNSVIPKLLPELTGSISIIKSSRNKLDNLTDWGDNWPGTPRFAPNDCWALRKGHQHFSTEHNIQTTCQHWEEIPEQQTLCIPLLAQGETIGVLHFIFDMDIDINHKQELWTTIAEQIGLTLANIQLRDSLREQAIRDPLTSLYNRRYMLEVMEQLHSRAERTKTEISVMMLDLDHFKLFNDNFGHDAGDYVLKGVSQVLKNSTRQEDITCRYGGEEFCIVCPNTSQDQAELIANRICVGLRTLELNRNGLSLGTVTTSIGIAVYPNHASTMDEAIKAADEALYLAKQNGRNRIEISTNTETERLALTPATAEQEAETEST